MRFLCQIRLVVDHRWPSFTWQRDHRPHSGVNFSDEFFANEFARRSRQKRNTRWWFGESFDAVVFDKLELGGVVSQEIVRLQLFDDICSDCGQVIVRKKALEEEMRTFLRVITYVFLLT